MVYVRLFYCIFLNFDCSCASSTSEVQKLLPNLVREFAYAIFAGKATKEARGRGNYVFLFKILIYKFCYQFYTLDHSLTKSTQ